MTPAEIVREEALKRGQSLQDKLVEHIIWEETGYPTFWSIPTDGNTWEECFRTQINRYLAKRGAAVELTAKPDGVIE